VSGCNQTLESVSLSETCKVIFLTEIGLTSMVGRLASVTPPSSNTAKRDLVDLLLLEI
jgi:hypothetical protein